MRITGGSVKGRRLVSPKGMKVRPTSEKVREAVFNIIGNDLTGIVAADFFAGTGVLGLEALSRGAQGVLFVDNAESSVRLIQKNLALCGFEYTENILKWDLRRGIPDRWPASFEALDLAFLDPPYMENFLPGLLEQLSKRSLISIHSRVVTESAKNDIPPEIAGSLHMISTRLYGDTRISIYVRKE
ncbi:MAG: 16S rRNA (guanine(966)-N(2))-methyltransferase RsmD [Deltaproteobacteria bacterium]|nr:16S rRNA (guanine(966)-N(2))-methyltransferase RsmD [Deltaproteobacteria bacterium]